MTSGQIAELLRSRDAVYTRAIVDVINAAIGASVFDLCGVNESRKADEETGLTTYLEEGDGELYRLNTSRLLNLLKEVIGTRGEVEEVDIGVWSLGFAKNALGRLKGRKLYLSERASLDEVEKSALVISLSEEVTTRDKHVFRFADLFEVEEGGLTFSPDIIDANTFLPASSKKGARRNKKIDEKKLCEKILDWLIVGLSNYSAFTALRDNLKTQDKIAAELGISKATLSRLVGVKSPPSRFKGFYMIFHDPKLFTLFESYAKKQRVPLAKRRKHLLTLTPEQLYAMMR